MASEAVEAAIVTGSIGTTFTNFSISVDIDGDSINDFLFYATVGISRAFAHGLGTNRVYATLANGLYLNNISYSNSLSGVLTQRGYADAFGGGGTGGQNWSAGGYMGFTLGGNQGWLQLTYSPFTLQLGQFAYEDTGAAISAGHTTSQPIPEPGTLFTLALGAAGLLAWRKHRQKQAEKAQQDAETNS